MEWKNVDTITRGGGGRRSRSRSRRGGTAGRLSDTWSQSMDGIHRNMYNQ